MLPTVPGSTEQYIADLKRLNTEMTDVERQLSSGQRVQNVGDDPAAVRGILDAQTRITQIQQSQTNLGQLQTELSSGDAALQQAIRLVDSAISTASQASSPLSNPAQQAALVQTAQGIQQALVNLTATQAGGRYIFSGDLDQQPLYALNPNQPNGVNQLANAKSTRVITDVNGSQLWVGKTATEIFDHQNPNGTPSADNVFAAINKLVTALQNNDSAGATASIDSLKAANDHLNLELGYYGIGETRATDALDSAGKSLIAQQQVLSALRDTDVATAALQLNQLEVQQQAALSSRAKITGQNLFDFLA
jgi:flagellar hook-associated protein 3 FlgL